MPTTQNPAKLAGPNPQPKAEEIRPLTEADIDLVTEELGPRYGPAVLFVGDAHAAIGVVGDRVA